MRRCSRGATWSKPAGASCSRFSTTGLRRSRQISRTTPPAAAVPKLPTSCSPKTAGGAGGRSATRFELAASGCREAAVDPVIGLDGRTPGERRCHRIAAHAVEAAALAKGAERTADRAEERLRRRLLEQEAGAVIVDGVGKAAGPVPDRQ